MQTQSAHLINVKLLFLIEAYIKLIIIPDAEDETTFLVPLNSNERTSNRSIR